jgi:hypothetical protein
VIRALKSRQDWLIDWMSWRWIALAKGQRCRWSSDPTSRRTGLGDIDKAEYLTVTTVKEILVEYVNLAGV